MSDSLVCQISKGNSRAVHELAKLCGLSEEKVTRDLRRDFYLTAPEAVAYGIVDHVMLPSQVLTPESLIFSMFWRIKSHTIECTAAHQSNAISR